MKSSVSLFKDHSKIQSDYVGKISKKLKQKSIVTFISPSNKLQNIFDKKQVIQKHQSDRKKHAQKKKNMTCINLGVDEDYLDVSTQINKPGLKIKSRQIYVQSQRKQKVKQGSKKQLSQTSNKNLRSKPQSQNQKRFSILEPNKEKENLIKFEKKLVNNLVKRKDQKSNAKSNFNETFKNFYDTNNHQISHNSICQPTLNIKKETIHQQTVQFSKKNQDMKNTMSSSKVSLNKQKIKHQLNLSRYKSKQKQDFLRYKKLSQSRLRHNLTDMVLIQNEMQQKMSCNQTLDGVKIHNNFQQYRSSPNITSKNQCIIKERNERIEKNKIKAVDQNLKFKKFDLNKLQSAIHRSQNVSTHIKFVPHNKSITNERSQLNSREFMKCRNTCPITKQNQSIFTPWEYMPTQKQIPDVY